MTVAPAQSPTDQAELLAMAYTLSRLSKLLCHEINQPLNTISITAHNGKRQAQDGSHPIADTHSRFDRIGQEVRRAGALVHALADLASPGATPAGILVPRLREIEDLHRARLRRRGLETHLAIEQPLGDGGARPATVVAALVWLFERLDEGRTGQVDPEIAKLRIERDGALRTIRLTGFGPVGAPAADGASLPERILLSSGARVTWDERRCWVDVPTEVVA